MGCFSYINLKFKMFLTNFNFYKFRFDKIKNVIMIHLVFSSVVKRLSRILDMDESAVQLCAELPINFLELLYSSVVKRLSHILHMDGSAVQLCPELPSFFIKINRKISISTA